MDNEKLPIFGQTGCGKSTLTNALFGTKFDVDDVKPCTKEPQAHHGKDANGNPVIFWDLPGIGESAEADSQYLKMYKKIASTCDVILWAFQADTRSIGVDVQVFKHIITQQTEDEKRNFLNKVAVIVTKADTVNFDSWIFAKNGGATIIASGKKTEKVLKDKTKYFYDGLLGEYSNQITNRTFVSQEVTFQKMLPNELWLDKDKRHIYCKGRMEKEIAKLLIKKYPFYHDEINRLHGCSQGVFCSSRFQFNLNEVKNMVVQKASGTSLLRLNQSIVKESTSIRWAKIKKLGFPIIFLISKSLPLKYFPLKNKVFRQLLKTIKRVLRL